MLCNKQGSQQLTRKFGVKHHTEGACARVDVGQGGKNPLRRCANFEIFKSVKWLHLVNPDPFIDFNLMQ